MNLKIEEARSSDIEEIIAFHNESYNDNRVPAHWVWEYNGYDSQLSVFTVIKDPEERIVATQGMLPYYLIIQGKRRLTAKSENTLLAPEYRGGGIFTDFYNYAASLCKTRGMVCIWGYTPASKALINWGFQMFENVMCISYSILDPWVALGGVNKEIKGFPNQVMRSLEVFLHWMYSSLTRAIHRTTKRTFTLKVHPINHYDLRDLYGRIRDNYPELIHIDFDDRYLQWRIYNHPTIKYKTYCVYEGNLLRAYAVLNTHYLYRAYLTDFTFENLSAGEFLLEKILAQLRTEGVGYVSFWGNVRNPMIKEVFNLLQSFGFILRPTRMHFCIRNLINKDKMTPSDIKNWYMNGLWTEGYRM